jgi:hypothetical protein
MDVLVTEIYKKVQHINDWLAFYSDIVARPEKALELVVANIFDIFLTILTDKARDSFLL